MAKKKESDGEEKDKVVSSEGLLETYLKDNKEVIFY
jgi:hypothetical protein